jgi:hypothetical protein
MTQSLQTGESNGLLEKANLILFANNGGIRLTQILLFIWKVECKTENIKLVIFLLELLS